MLNLCNSYDISEIITALYIEGIVVCPLQFYQEIYFYAQFSKTFAT